MGIERHLDKDVEITLTAPDAEKYKDGEPVEPTEYLKPTDDLSATFTAVPIEAGTLCVGNGRTLYYLRGENGGVVIQTGKITLDEKEAIGFDSRKEVDEVIKQIKHSKVLREKFGEWLILYEVEVIESCAMCFPHKTTPIKVIRLKRKTTKRTRH